MQTTVILEAIDQAETNGLYTILANQADGMLELLADSAIS